MLIMQHAILENTKKLNLWPMQKNYFFPLEEYGQLSFKKHLEANFQKNPGEMRSILKNS